MFVIREFVVSRSFLLFVVHDSSSAPFCAPFPNVTTTVVHLVNETSMGVPSLSAPLTRPIKRRHSLTFVALYLTPFHRNPSWPTSTTTNP